MTSKVSSEDRKDARMAVSTLHRFLTETVASTTSRIETQHPNGHDCVGDEDVHIPTSRILVTTSTIEDSLWRGDDALVKDMGLQTYNMCVYRMERRPPIKDPDDCIRPRHIEMDFSTDYTLSCSDFQSIPSEFRVSLFQGYTMPPSVRDRESACLYKQLSTRPLAVPIVERPEDIRLVASFATLSAPQGPKVNVPIIAKGRWAAEAFRKAWETFSTSQREMADEGKRRF